MGLSAPFFSVVIPTHNRPALLVRAVESVLAPDRQDVEIIVVNDGSSVSYREFAGSYGDKLRYEEKAVSSGVASARNLGVSLSNGEWVIFLDDDDELAAGYLERIKETVKSVRDCCAVWSGVKIIRKANNCIRVEERTFSKSYHEQKYLVNDFLSISLGFGFAIRKKVFEDIGMFDEDFSVAEDTELFVRLVSNNYIPMPIPGIGVIKHEEHSDRLSADFEVYSRNNVYNRILEKNKNGFCEKWRYSYIQLLMWSYRLHRQYGRRDFENNDLARLVQMGIPQEHIEDCYLSYSELSAEYLG
ncbi:MAG TPA: glycosyltransferase family 2 protein [Cyclobacteriaceae bacterium]